MGEDNSETGCDNDPRQQPANSLYFDIREFPQIFISKSNSIGFIKVVLYLEAKEQSEELVNIPGKTQIILVFVRLLDLSLGIAAACLLWCQCIEILTLESGRCKDLQCVVFLHLCFSHFRVNLQLMSW